MEHAKNICSSVFEREGKFGVHLSRKTGYLYGVWGRVRTLTLCSVLGKKL